MFLLLFQDDHSNISQYFFDNNSSQQVPMMNRSRQKSLAISCTWAPSCAVLSYCVASRQNTLQLYLGSFLCYLTGFILWNLDNHTCPTLQYIRAALPTFLRPFIQVLLLHISDLFNLTHSQGVVFKYSSLLSVTK